MMSNSLRFLLIIGYLEKLQSDGLQLTPAEYQKCSVFVKNNSDLAFFYRVLFRTLYEQMYAPKHVLSRK